uniref:Uncharacterized protein n=1 Tax=Strongyloides papillosus TaxID=174720 RepID=A0A0N5C2J8_STREA
MKIKYPETKEIEKVNFSTVKLLDHPLKLGENRKLADKKPFVGEKVEQSSKMGKKLFPQHDDKLTLFSSKDSGGLRKRKRDLYIKLKLDGDEGQELNKDGELEWNEEQELDEDYEKEWDEGQELDENNEKEWDEEQELDEDNENEENEDKEPECYKDKEPEYDEDNMRIDEFLDIMRKAFTNNDTENNTVKKEDPIKSFRNT